MTVRGNLCKPNISTLIHIKLNAMTEPTETFSQLTLLSITPILSTITTGKTQRWSQQSSSTIQVKTHLFPQKHSVHTTISSYKWEVLSISQLSLPSRSRYPIWLWLL